MGKPLNILAFPISTLASLHFNKPDEEFFPGTLKAVSCRLGSVPQALTALRADATAWYPSYLLWILHD